MKIVIDWKQCEGNGICSVEAPDVFELDDDDNLTVLLENPGDELRAGVEAAVRSCPKRAISLAD
jgi:ferredoxin